MSCTRCRWWRVYLLVIIYLSFFVLPRQALGFSVFVLLSRTANESDMTMGQNREERDDMGEVELEWGRLSVSFYTPQQQQQQQKRREYIEEKLFCGVD